MIKLITLLVSLSFISWIQSNPVPEDASVDWSTRISDNVDSIVGPTKFSFDDSSEDVDSTFAKREAAPVSGPLDAPLGWGARIESSPSASGSVDVAPSSSSGAVIGGGGGSSVGTGGGDYKQKVDWALNPGDNKRMYSTNESPEVIEQKKEETLPLVPESVKPSEESNPDPYKNILPAVLTGKRRLGEGDKPVQPSTSSSGANEGDIKSTVTDSKEKVVPVTTQVEGKGQTTGQVLPYEGPYPLKPTEGGSIPRHVYTEDQFPSVITIKGREYLVIPHKSQSVQPSAAQTSVGTSWYTIPGPVQHGGSFAQTGHFGSPFFGPSSSTYQLTQVSKSNQTAPTVTPSTVTEVPTGGHHQFVQQFLYPVHSSYQSSYHGPSFPQHPGTSSITWSGRYPVYHSSVFTSPNAQHSGSSSHSSVKLPENSGPSVFASFFPQYGPYGTTGGKSFEFITPPTHTVTVSSTGGSTTPQGDKTVVVASPPSFIVPSDQSVAAAPAGEFKGNPNLVPDPSFSPKLQESVHSPPSITGGGWSKGGSGVVVNSQQESFDNKPLKPESNLHAPPQVPLWMPTGFSVVAGGYPVQAPSVAVSSSSSSVSSSQPLPSSAPAVPTSSKTHVESPVTVTVDTKFPPIQSPSSSPSSSGDNGVKGGSTTWSVEPSTPSVVGGSFNVDSVAGQSVAKGQLPPQQQDQQQVGVAGETVVPTTILDAKNQIIPSSGYFVSSPPVNQVPSSIYGSSAILSSSSGHVQGQRQFMVNSWQSSGYNNPILASAPAPHYESTSSWDIPFYHQQGIVYNQGLEQPDFDLNQIPPARMFRPTAFAN